MSVEVQVPSRGELMAAVTDARRDLHATQSALGESMQHIAEVERQNAVQAALLCGFAAMLGPNTLAVSFDRYDAVSGLQVVVQPDPESNQLIFYVRMQEQETDDAATQRAGAEAGTNAEEGPITDIGWRRAGAGVRAAQSAPDASEPEPVAAVEPLIRAVGSA